jgi:TolA-binding protein
MNDIENKIVQYGSLNDDEQRRVEAYVDAHPRWHSLLEEVKALEALRTSMVSVLRTDDDILAYYVVATHTGLSPSAPLKHAFAELEARLDADAALQAQYEALAQRLDTMAEDIDPVAQFESLTGFRLNDSDAASNPRLDEDAAQAGRNEENARIVMLPRAARWAAAAVVLVAVLYGGLYGLSRATQSSIERLAVVDASETQIEGYALTTRGTPATSDVDSSGALYLDALRTLREARESTLGLFPRYNTDKLSRAETLLQRVIEREGPRSFLQVEAYFFLGKVHLAQGNIEAARSNFQTVALREGRRSIEATEILTELQEEHPAHGQSYVG